MWTWSVLMKHWQRGWRQRCFAAVVRVAWRSVLQIQTTYLALFEKLIATQLVKKFLIFYGTRTITTALRRARYVSLSCSKFLPKKVDGFYIVKKIRSFYWTHGFITALTRARHLSLSWARPIHSISPSHFLKIHFNITLPSTSRFSKLPVFLTSPHQNPVYTSPVLHTRHMFRPSHSSWCDCPNNIWWGAEIIKLLIM